MKKLMVIMAVMGLICLPLYAQTQSLYEQEGSAADGYGAIDASGQGPANANFTNWKYQYGGGTWTGIYGSEGWIEESTSGDSSIEIECDIEMFYTETYADNKIYFHFGDPYNATTDDRQAFVTGTVTYNNGMYVGISFDGTGKTEDNLEDDGAGGYTGKIFDAMIGTVDVLGRDISAENFDATILLGWGSGYQPPVTFGTGASGTILNTVWWLIENGAPGTYNLTWKITLHPEANQPDGNYNFDPFLVAAPEL